MPAAPGWRLCSSRTELPEDAGATELRFEQAAALEEDQPRAAVDAYRRALALEPALAEAHLNLGRLLHETGDLAGAEEHYRQALACHSESALAAYNLGVALQDQGRPQEALALAYQRALEQDPDLADAHFNLSGLYEDLGDKKAAFRHLRTYHKLAGPSGRR